MTIKLRIFPRAGSWHFGLDEGRLHDTQALESAGYRSKQQATAAAIAHGLKLTHGDSQTLRLGGDLHKEIARQAGIKYDSQRSRKRRHLRLVTGAQTETVPTPPKYGVPALAGSGSGSSDSPVASPPPAPETVPTPPKYGVPALAGSGSGSSDSPIASPPPAPHPQTVNIFPFRLEWHYSLAGDFTPNERSAGYETKSAATRAALTSALVKGPIASVIGQPDWKICRAHGIFHPPPAAPTPTPKPPLESAAKLSALAKARRSRATSRDRQPPDGYRSVDHFLDDVREWCARHSIVGGAHQYSPHRDLAKYLGVDHKAVWRWLQREKTPIQPTIDAIHQWLLNKKLRKP